MRGPPCLPMRPAEAQRGRLQPRTTVRHPRKSSSCGGGAAALRDGGSVLGGVIGRHPTNSMRASDLACTGCGEVCHVSTSRLMVLFVCLFYRGDGIALH